MPQIDYEAEYDNRARVPEHPQIFAKWAKDAEAYRARMASGAICTMSYGATSREIDRSLPRTRPTLRLRYSSMAAGGEASSPPCSATWRPGSTPTASMSRCRDTIFVRRSASPTSLRRCAARLLHLWRRYGKRMLVFGHSAGGHLTAAMMATDWPALDAAAPRDLVPAGYAISGVFDLVPLVATSMNADFRLDEERARTISPLLWPAPRGALDAVAGALESSEFLRQSRAIVDALGQGGHGDTLRRDRRRQSFHSARSAGRSG